MNALIACLKQYGRLTPAAEEALHQHTYRLEKKKGDFLLKQGQVATSLFLLEKGVLRAFFMKNGKEVNSWFCFEQMISGSILPLYSDNPSFENIQFLEDAVILAISKTDLNHLYIAFPEINLIGRKIAEEICMVLEQRITSLHTETAEERYRGLVTAYPGILQRINLGHIASYLGITQETLSRIRKR